MEERTTKKRILINCQTNRKQMAFTGASLIIVHYVSPVSKALLLYSKIEQGMIMIKDVFLNKIRSIRHSYAHLPHYFFKRNSPESVYFYTFHKCAITLFSDYELKNVSGLYNMDYAVQLYTGRRSAEKKLNFKKMGLFWPNSYFCRRARP
jgi:hypothetical protein